MTPRDTPAPRAAPARRPGPPAPRVDPAWQGGGSGTPAGPPPPSTRPAHVDPAWTGEDAGLAPARSGAPDTPRQVPDEPPVRDAEALPAGTAPSSAVPAARGRGRHAAPRGGRLGRGLVRAAVVSGVLTVAGAVLGLLRDQTIAHLFGASSESDAFLIAWTVPELAATLLIEDAMALLLVPAFSHALARKDDPGAVRDLVSATFPRLFAVLVGVAALLMAGAPLVVRLLAPGFGDPRLAVECTRLTALTVLTFGVTGYFSAALRAHGSFLAPAAVYTAYNAGIIATTLALHSLWGVRAAAAGVAVGGALMILVQAPGFARHLGGLAPLARPRRTRGTPLIGAALLAPVVLFAVSRQAQVLVERFLAAPLPAGAISHLNYAQKVAQMPMVLSLMVCTVTFPVVAQAMATGDRERARRRVEEDLAMAGTVVLLGTAYVVGYAPAIIDVLFRRGAFDAQDSATTAGVMRVYAAGLLGHCLVGALGRPFFSAGRPTWFPAAAMAVGLAVTVAAGAAAVGPYGVHGIAAANAAGISVTALLLLHGLGSRVVVIEVRAIGLRIGRLALAAAAATGAALIAAPVTGGPVVTLAAGVLLVPLMFLVTARALGAPEAVHLLALVHRRLRHDR
ncbi:lipid II flippase MurJ [Streptomyces zhihengii]|uniref:murein biosynthesis integral membrane protein MurJ n=1 Tax=Streptomyces zhihengii TaxID=1818004 RepID=UPI003453845C